MYTKRNLSPMKTLSPEYWQEAVRCFKDSRMLAVAALMIALRVAVKLLKLPLAEGLSLSFDCYVNAVGSLIYGPLVALAVGAVSDTLGCILIPSGDYFLPFILVEMGSSFLFALFFWRKVIKPEKVLLAKFTVNLVCNIILTSLFMKWYYYFYFGPEKAQAYSVINLVRIGKNLVLFPLEGALITVILQLLTPALMKMNLLSPRCVVEKQDRIDFWIEIIVLMVISVGFILFYIFFLKDFLSSHNIKLF